MKKSSLPYNQNADLLTVSSIRFKRNVMNGSVATLPVLFFWANTPLRGNKKTIKVLNMIKLHGKPICVNKASQDKKIIDVGANLWKQMHIRKSSKRDGTKWVWILSPANRVVLDKSEISKKRKDFPVGVGHSSTSDHSTATTTLREQHGDGSSEKTSLSQDSKENSKARGGDIRKIPAMNESFVELVAARVIVDSSDECFNLTNVDSPPYYLLLINFSFKNASQLASISYDVLLCCCCNYSGDEHAWCCQQNSEAMSYADEKCPKSPQVHHHNLLLTDADASPRWLNFYI
ncbi:hypothetical protein Bca52824_053805 [Brassica carinata]|uniref:Uncharacterized protein n=1 Tax=Brassica carinata TaxID=52824 RepID=A0A8X7UJY2_BRACI|nr:hypothetical protein Bca52824_053805 [Brassica carinata]